MEFLDGSFLKGATFSKFADNVKECVTLLKPLGFVIHPDKSVLVPTEKLTFLGFVRDSQLMRISLTTEKSIQYQRSLSVALISEYSLHETFWQFYLETCL